MIVRNERFEMRLPADQKELLERAASLTGQPLTSFALSILLERARSIVESYGRTSLSRTDQEQFLRLLDAEEAPAPALKAAVKRARARRA